MFPASGTPAVGNAAALWYWQNLLRRCEIIQNGKQCTERKLAVRLIFGPLSSRHMHRGEFCLSFFFTQIMALVYVYMFPNCNAYGQSWPSGNERSRFVFITVGLRRPTCDVVRAIFSLKWADFNKLLDGLRSAARAKIFKSNYHLVRGQFYLERVDQIVGRILHFCL